MQKIRTIFFFTASLVVVGGLIAIFFVREPDTNKIPAIVNYANRTTAMKPDQFLQVANASETREKDATEVTVYNQNLALIKETRRINLKKGYNEVKYIDIPSEINAQSVLFTDPEDLETQVVEQSYEYDLVSTKKMLEKYLDKDIAINAQEGETTKSYTGKLLSYTDGILLETSEGVVQLKNIDKISFAKLEAGLLTKPTLVWTIWANKEGEHKTKTSYLTGGMTWQADYVAEVNAEDNKINLEGWTTIENHSGTSYPRAALKLVAGDVNVVTKQPRASNQMYDMAEEKALAPSMGGFKEEGLFEYHMYTLGRQTDLKNNASKQISLLKANSIPAEKEFVFDDQKSDKVRTVLKFKNSEDKNLGMPLPKGTLRVYKADQSGQLQFVGEDSIDHTPKDEEVEVFLGNAFDLVAEKKVMDSKRGGSILQFGKSCEEQSIEVTLKNHKKEDVKITVVHHLWGTDTQIVVSSVVFEKEDEYTYKFRVPVKIDEEKKLTYTVRNCW